MLFAKPDWQYSKLTAGPAHLKPQDSSENEWPDRSDAGQRVQIEYPDGRIFAGRLEIEDMIRVGEDDEPLFAVIDDAGRRHGFSNVMRWHFAGH